MTGQHNTDNENFVRATLGTFGIGVWSWRGSPARVRCCPMAARMFGVAAADGWDGLPLDRFVAAIHPDDRERYDDLVAQAQRTGGPFVAEYRTIAEAGSERRVLDRAVFEIGPAGQAVAARGIVVDVTDRPGMHDVGRGLTGSPNIQGLPPLDQAVEHALALRGLIDVIPGEKGRLAGAMLNQMLAMLGVELAAALKRDGHGPETSPGLIH